MPRPVHAAPAGAIVRRCARWVVVAGGIALLAGGPVRGRPAPAVRPNVLFLVIDDLNDALGCYGDPRAVTPNLDALAARGCVFERAYCQQALCAPSRASVLTGRRPETFPETMAGSQTAHYRSVLPDVVTLPQAFKQAGYRTEAIGKVNHVYPPLLDPPSWSVPERLADIPKRDEYLGPENRVGGFINPMVKGAATERIEAPDSAYQDGQVADVAIEALARLQGGAFFLAVGFKRPHLPWTAPEKYWRMHEADDYPQPGPGETPADEVARFPWRFEWQPSAGELRGYADIPAQGGLEDGKIRELRQGYYAAVSFVDAQVGRIIRQLDALQLTERTIIVVWSDNGYHLGDAGQWGKKRNTERATRVPLLVVAPGRTTPGTRNRALVELVDLFPTLADLAGIAAPAGLEGTSFAPLLADPARAWKPAVFSIFQRGEVIGRSMRTPAWRFTEWTRRDEVIDRELYPAGAAECEADNLAGTVANSDLVAQLAARLHAGWTGSRPPSDGTTP